ncbi:hypothetical protein DES38_11443 [Streptohalobacillus salinus]|uniref:Uncharacterized protein n=1 Tax=Streptohalobacillus salinus TaxID=621096 RepID=A0A2V3W2Q1_9BACI|nr:hypothetical protein [Streptohalobacillus salinus]PXW88180.1 hypothetical protein DES38_11443 [Streptohalobacillus salinus]
MRKLFVISLIALSLVLLSACGVSEEEVAEVLESRTDEMFEAEKPAPNQSFASFEIYLPDNFEVQEEAESNLILESDNQMYLMFYNTLEDQMSDFFYRSIEESDQYTFLKSYQDDQRFGYVKVALVEELYEVQVGIGGIRMTTHTELDQVETEVEQMITIIDSVAFIEEATE